MNFYSTFLKPNKSLIFLMLFTSLLYTSCKQQESKSAESPESNAPSENTTLSTGVESKEEDKNSDDEPVILVFGDSITAGYGLEDTNDAFPAIVEQKLDSLGYDYEVINSGVSGETSAGGKSRISWVMNNPVDIFILELGGNDGLRGLPLSQTKENLQTIINTVQEKSPNAHIVLAGMQLPPNLGQQYTQDFKALYYELAEKNALTFIPFILENVGGVEELNQNDGIHPTKEGHKIIANTVVTSLKNIISKESYY